MDDDNELAPMRANMRAFYRLFGTRSPGGSVVETDGVLAAIVPSCPGRSIFNAVVYEHPSALAAAYDEIAASYDDAGVRAWTVWVPEADRATADLLRRAGHSLDASPRAMTLDLGSVELDPPADLEFERTGDAGPLAELNEVAYGLPSGEFTEAMTAMADAPVHLYLVRQDREPASCLGTLDATPGGTLDARPDATPDATPGATPGQPRDCGVYFVATAPHARGRGLAGGLLRHALADARRRGCGTSSLQATKAGFPVYSRIGYRDICAIEMWERRTS